VNVTKDQIKESLIRLKDYSYWMYYDKKSKELLEKQIIKYEGHKFSLSLTDYGMIKMILENGIECLYDAKIVTMPLRENSIDNIDIQARIMNKSDLTPEYIEFFTKAGGFVCSYFQRATAFTFFCRMADETIDGIASYLVQCNK
jgi:hypothetical protein